jgi:hypothetical protein
VIVKTVLSACFIVLASLHLHAQTAAPAQSTAAATKRLSDHVNPELPRWFRFNGEYRMRFEGIGDAGFRPNANDAYVLSRLRLNTTFTAATWLKLQLQAQDSQAMGRNAKPDAPPFENTFDLRQAYVEVGNVETSRLGLRAGRQELAFGEMRLLGHLNWTNTARSFDAVRASYRSKNFRVDAFAASVVNLREGDYDKRTEGNNLYGVYASFSALVPKATIEPYTLWRVTSSLGDFTTTGLRWVGKLPAGFDYGVEMAGQTGTLSIDDMRAWAGHWVLGYTIPTVRYTPRVIAEYNFASGDADPNDRKRGTFDQLYPTGHDKLGLSDQVGWRNVHNIRSGVELKPSPKITMSAAYHSWWLAQTRDGLYNAAGALVARVSSGTAGRHIGHEADVQTIYAPNGQVQIGAGYAHVFPGTFLKNATPGKSYKSPYLMFTYLF